MAEYTRLGAATDEPRLELESEKEENAALLSSGEDVDDENDTELPTNPRPRRSIVKTAILSLLCVGALVAVAALFHPSSPLRKHLQRPKPEDFYHGAPLGSNGAPLGGIGAYSGDAQFAPNPLASDSKFGDVPFATVGRPLYSAVDEDAPDPARKTRSNGTHDYDRTVIVISMDGVRPDYLTKSKTPHLLDLASKGIMADYLEPVFPSLTFPNHWSLLTGLYPSSHGIVANDFWDPQLGREFVYTEPSKSWASDWWGGEPIWSTAVKNGLRSAVMMWPGPPKMSDGIQPTYWVAFKNHYSYRQKVDKIAEWLDMPYSKRPNLIAAYAPEVDQEGHHSGPFTPGVDGMLHKMDQFAKMLKVILAERNLLDIVDVVIVSDHGMTDTHNERLVFLDDILGPDGFAGIERNEGWPSAGLRFKDSINKTDMVDRLERASTEAKGGFNVYTPSTMPERWHFAGHERIADVYVVPHVGWAISDRHDFHVTMNGDYVPKGNHGYDNADPSMHAIFIGHGPFALRLKKQTSGTQTMPGFANLEVYDLLARLLDIPEGMRAPNNGTRGFWDRYLDPPAARSL